MCKLSKISTRVVISLMAMAFVMSGLAHATESDIAKVVFVAGDAKMAKKTVTLNAMVSEGAQIETGSDGFVYLKTVDNGFLIVRPNSTIRIVTYQIDKLKPENTRIKLELLNGVARSISGDAVKLSRQNFRFNTPVAAIGVRGTDFTVFTDQQVSRVSVLSGGVVVSGFGGSCTPLGNGPCEGNSAVELFASQQGKLLQIMKDQVKPNLFNGTNVSPDVISPPRNDEPSGKPNVVSTNLPTVGAITNGSNDVTIDPLKNATLPSYIQNTQANAKALENSVVWGRWATIAGMAPNLDVSKQEQTKLIAASPYYAVYQSKTSEWQVPVVGSMGFSLKGGDAFVFDEKANSATAATLENGRLQLDFASASFVTGFDLVTKDERFNMQARGEISADGKLAGNSQFSSGTNMAVQGVVTAEKGGTASYLFQRRFDNNRLAYGVTYWSK
ncbi:FecR family protein [Undibacterium baiyunense]|uniref:FecR domain-containing protein n=1 Tax=Undibacterium baiyunense TaxID=2828731 RepID=A0A941DLT1_9BURK|nr:FecR family protein [Undibacterium baiyunense]MBR7748467.1 FecR domain-containing protein [Undibacterium baiyunense]